MALTHDRSTPEREGKLLVLPMAASTAIYAGALVAVNGDGYAVPGSTATGLTAAGRAEEYKTNGTTAGTETVAVRRGVFKFANLEADPVTKPLLDSPLLAMTGSISLTPITRIRTLKIAPSNPTKGRRRFRKLLTRLPAPK